MFELVNETAASAALVPGWTLNYEMFFYILFAATLLVAKSARFVVLCGLLLFGLLGPWAAWWRSPTSRVGIGIP